MADVVKKPRGRPVKKLDGDEPVESVVSKIIDNTPSVNTVQPETSAKKPPVRRAPAHSPETLRRIMDIAHGKLTTAVDFLDTEADDAQVLKRNVPMIIKHLKEIIEMLKPQQ